jgi:hypothetical protein
MEPLPAEISRLADASIRALRVAVEPELLSDVLTLLASMGDGAERLMQALREMPDAS